MLEANIERVRRALDAIGRRDVRAMVDIADASFEMHPLVSVWQRTYRGHEGIDRWRRDLDELWDEFSVEPRSFRDLGDDTLLVVAHWRARPRGRATELDGPTVAVVRFRGEKAVRADFYLDEEQAMAAVESGRPAPPR